MIKYFVFAIVCSFVVLQACKTEKELTSTDRNHVIIGYVPGFRGAIDVSTIDANKLTHINYAFVNVLDSVAVLTNLETDTINFRLLNSLKAVNPELKIFISLGGWSWSDYFSDAVLTERSRKKFAKSSIDIVARYHLDGVDIDWEYPGMRGEDNVFRPEDKENFTLMFKELRRQLDSLSQDTGKKYLLSTAVPEFAGIFDKTNMGEAAKYMDYVNVMAYDFHVVAGDTVGHHANLYDTESRKGRSAHEGILRFIKHGVPAEKLVLGVPFYGRSWIMKTADNKGLNRVADSLASGGGYTEIKDSIAKLPGYQRYWDDKAKSPYLFNEDRKQLIVYDDEESVKIKCDYVKENNLAGVMFWEYSSDPKLYLLNVINQELNNSGSTKP